MCEHFGLNASSGMCPMCPYATLVKHWSQLSLQQNTSFLRLKNRQKGTGYTKSMQFSHEQLMDPIVQSTGFKGSWIYEKFLWFCPHPYFTLVCCRRVWSVAHSIYINNTVFERSTTMILRAGHQRTALPIFLLVYLAVRAVVTKPSLLAIKTLDTYKKRMFGKTKQRRSKWLEKDASKSSVFQNKNNPWWFLLTIGHWEDCMDFGLCTWLADFICVHVYTCALFYVWLFNDAAKPKLLQEMFLYCV